LGSGRAQKNDPNDDARSVAIAARRNRGLTRVGLDDHAQVLKMLAKRHRDLAQSRAETASRLHALLTELQPGGMAKRMNVKMANGILDTITIDTAIVEHRVGVARELVADLVHIEAQMKASKARLRRAVAASTSLTDIRSIGVGAAAMIIGHVGNIDRFATAAHFGQEHQRSNPSVETTDLQRRLPGTRHRRPPPTDVMNRPGRTLRNDTKSCVTGSTS
jgi:transposase